ncbi:MULTISPECIES: hypothetical protein [unclassified Streptomyces]|uniref:hypothetical protein n=1 Tax=unclassified Streptomyces TaxID=2593676 RepID=UPI0036E15AEF
MAGTAGALRLCLLQTVVDASAETNSTLVMPFPVEMLRFPHAVARDRRDNWPTHADSDADTSHAHG